MTVVLEPDDFFQLLEAFVSANKEALQKQDAHLMSLIFAPFKNCQTGHLGRQKAFDLLTSCADIAEARLQDICKKHSIDFWLACIRQLPSLMPGLEQAWLAHSTLAVIKWADWDQDTSKGQVQLDKGFGVKLGFPEGDLLDSCDIAAIGSIIAEINVLRRWIGKGGTIVHDGGPKLYTSYPKDVQQAVAHYERRVPYAPWFAYEGIFTPSVTLPKNSFIRSPFFILGNPPPAKTSLLLRETGQTYPINHFPCVYNPDGISVALKPYEEAIEDLFGANLNAVLHVLHAFCRLVFDSLTVPIKADAPDYPNSFVYDQSLSDRNFKHKFEFMLGFCRRGLVRFPQEYLKQRLSETLCPPYSNSPAEAKDLVDSFFAAFLLKDDQRDLIDVIRLQPIPLLYTSPGGNCYFDFLWLTDFLQWLVMRSRDWYPTQHGDRFALALKRFITQRVGGLTVLPQRKEYQSPSGIRAQIDLLIQVGDILYVIECKAFSKSRAFWLGEPKATTDRLQRIEKAVRQAKKASEVIAELVKAGDAAFSTASRVEWVVCLPTQEYLNPLERYGLLEADTPRVCTPEELVSHFINRYGAKVQ